MTDTGTVSSIGASGSEKVSTNGRRLGRVSAIVEAMAGSSGDGAWTSSKGTSRTVTSFSCPIKGGSAGVRAARVGLTELGVWIAAGGSAGKETGKRTGSTDFTGAD